MKTREHPPIATAALSDPCLRKLFLDAEDKMLKVREKLLETRESKNQTIESDRQEKWAGSVHLKKLSWAK